MLNIHYFYEISGWGKNVHIKYCATDKMWGDFMENPTKGPNFRKFRNYVLGENE